MDNPVSNDNEVYGNQFIYCPHCDKTHLDNAKTFDVQDFRNGFFSVLVLCPQCYAIIQSQILETLFKNAIGNAITHNFRNINPVWSR